jgi:hypothetical protein
MSSIEQRDIEPRLKALPSANLGELTTVDVGAHGVSEADVYTPVLLADTNIVGFEASRIECERLNAVQGPRRYYPFLIGDGRPGQFRSCKSPLTSSLLEPNSVLLERYENLAELCEVVGLQPVETLRLDERAQIGCVDFLKLDIQGGTLAALQGAAQLLTRTLIVHAETEFVPIYREELLFSKCKRFLRTQGFMFHHFHHLEGSRVKAGKYVVGSRPSQMLWADAVFLPSFERLEGLAVRLLARLAWMLHTIYFAYDFAMFCLERAAKNEGADETDQYAALLAQAGLLA